MWMGSSSEPLSIRWTRQSLGKDCHYGGVGLYIEGEEAVFGKQSVQCWTTGESFSVG